ncbi:MAG: MATE family efflux transporter [Spirochaetaceae bacterium]|nr:MATE family efflux transporter [Spirochaetaceae bacterium]
MNSHEINVGKSEKSTTDLMLNTPIPKLVIKMAIPTVLSTIVLSIYGMADLFFVSRLGPNASAAVGIVFSILTMFQAVGSMLGVGAGNIISRSLGAGDSSKADAVASVTFFCSIIAGIIVMILGIIFKTEVMIFLGATSTILPYAQDFAHYILIASPIMCSSFVLNIILRSQGKPKLSMIGLSIGGVLNIILEPIFIFSLKMGIAGAALATLISQTVSFIILLFMYLNTKSLAKIRFSFFMPNVSKVFPAVCSNGAPSLLRQGLVVVANVLLNIHASKFGVEAIAGIAITNRIFLLVVSVMFGLGQGFQPVAGFCLGANRFDRLKKAFYFTLYISVVVQTVFALLLYIFDSNIVRFFQKDKLVIEIGIQAIHYFALSLPLLPVVVITNMLYQVAEKNKQSLFLASCRQGIFFIPLIFTLPHFFGLTGLMLCQPIANVFSALISIPFLVWFMKHNPCKS